MSGTNKLNVNPDLDGQDRAKLTSLLDEYADLFAWSLSQVGRTTVGECELELLDRTPVHRPPYRVSHTEKEEIGRQVAEMLQHGVIKRCKSPYSSPVVLVRKKTGGWRFAVDYRGVNKVIKMDSYPLPVIDDVLSYLNGATFFTSLDLFSGFWQIPMAENSKDVTAFITPEGLFSFEVLPFGLGVSPRVFQRSMDRVLAGLKWSSCLVYLDDILVMGGTFDVHLARLREV